MAHGHGVSIPRNYGLKFTLSGTADGLTLTQCVEYTQLNKTAHHTILMQSMHYGNTVTENFVKTTAVTTLCKRIHRTMEKY
jgi:hypothetical protein